MYSTLSFAFILAGILIILLGALTIAIIIWFGFKRPEYRRTHFTGHTIGTVERMSNITSNDIRVPLVSYTVNGQTYKVAGPRFAGRTDVFAEVAGRQLLSSSSNITTDGELPSVVKTKGGISSAQKAVEERYPPGRNVDVFYDPKAPKHAFVERDAPPSKTISVILACIGGVIAAFGIAMFIIGIIVLAN